MSILTSIRDYVKTNLGTIGIGAGGIAAGAIMGSAATKLFSSKKTTKRKSKSKYVRKRNNPRHKRKRGQRYTPHTAGKGKDTSHRRIRHTKNGQPYVILANGRARFISKKSARTSRRRTGGKY